MRLCLVSLVVLIYPASATLSCKELNSSDGSSLSDILCHSSEHSYLLRRIVKALVGNKVMKRRRDISEPDDLEIEENDGNLGEIEEGGKATDKASGNLFSAQSSMNLMDDDCTSSKQDADDSDLDKRHMKRNCGSQKNANNSTTKAPAPGEKPMTGCNSCNKKEDAVKAPPPPAVLPPVAPPVEKPKSDCNMCNKKEDAVKAPPPPVAVPPVVPPVEKPKSDCNLCNKKDDAVKAPPPPAVVPPVASPVEKPKSDCNLCNKKDDAVKAPPPPALVPVEKPATEKKPDAPKTSPPIIIPPAEKPMNDCNCNKKDDTAKAPPPIAGTPPVEKPKSDCNCNKKEDNVKAVPPPSPTAIKTSPNQSVQMSTNSTKVVVIVENHMMPCGSCQMKSPEAPTNPAKPAPVPSAGPPAQPPKGEIKPPPAPPGLPPKVEIKPPASSGVPRVDPRPPVSPLPSGQPKSSPNEKPNIPIFTGSAITVKAQGITLSVALLGTLVSTLFNLGANILHN